MLAHPLPVAWAGSLAIYASVARNVPPRYRPALFLAAAACVILLRRILFLSFDVAWSTDQARHLTGADQLQVFGPRFAVVAAGLLAIWLFLLIQQLQTRGWKRVVLGVPFQLCILTCAGIFYLPNLVVLNGSPLGFQFIPERMSLALAVLVCALVGGAGATGLRAVAACALAVVFFAGLYSDVRVLNRLEGQVTRAVSLLPPGQRVVSTLCRTDCHLDPLLHMVDRACVGRCFSYGNYEPSSQQFSIRAKERNPMVAATRAEVQAIESGSYVVKPGDLPMYELAWDGGTHHLVARPLRAGDITGSYCAASPASGAVSARVYTAASLQGD
jgi:hypothetical protein